MCCRISVVGASQQTNLDTQGMPRKVNRLAHYALTSAALSKAKSVCIEHVQAAREEIAP